jgi:hypothetical protein
MTEKRDFEELATPATVAKSLGISVATLRKYSLIVEKVTADHHHYQRNKQKARLYSQQDIADLKAFLKLSKNRQLTLQEAARQIYAVSDKKAEDNKKEQAQLASQEQNLVDNQQLGKLLAALQKTISNQNTAIQSLQKQLNQISKQNQQLLKQQKQLAAPKKADSAEEKIAAMPDISGIVTPKTPAEKRAEVKADSHKSREEVRQEIMTKSKENQEKRRANSNVHRTLQDMQLPTKKHWWQRFLN